MGEFVVGTYSGWPWVGGTCSTVKKKNEKGGTLQTPTLPTAVENDDLLVSIGGRKSNYGIEYGKIFKFGSTCTVGASRWRLDHFQSGAGGLLQSPFWDAICLLTG